MNVSTHAAPDRGLRSNKKHRLRRCPCQGLLACNATGHFSFTGLPDGGWYVITVAAPVGGGPRMAVMRHVETNGDTVRVLLR